ncbi:hypothetical protein Tsubulata_032056 [Turnera subulata]|uniref:ABC transporter domain-containing protein n=1 Tax=Turnera subulata TaxID=218843 RepID=A0A9Q0F6D0_9ROSI|nr:hypothetical protein Tsubulata_032056 [Turnera subulata]
MNLVWENVTVELPTNGSNGRSTKKLLSELSGLAEPGRIMAIMGPSGSGKSTLLDSLAGRLSPNVKMTGNVLINGKRRSTDCRDISYVIQEDFFIGTLTVRETITYSAHLRLPSKMSKEEIESLVQNTIEEMGLEDCADSRIGNWHIRGISTGEKKRLSIGVEIITRPHILFLDEPTTGLDSASAFFVVTALRNIAFDGKIVICSIHQPSSDVFSLFDDLLLLSSGELVYFGDAKMAIKFFADAGFPCPKRRNPSDHFLRCISLDFDFITEALLRSHKFCGIKESSDCTVDYRTAETRAILMEKYRSSQLANNVTRRIQQISKSEDMAFQPSTGSNASLWKQLCTLTFRTFVNMYRDLGYYWLRIIFYVLVAISIGTLFFNVGYGTGAIFERGQATGFIFGFMICLSCGGLPFFIEEMKVYRKEILGGHYGVALLVLSNFFSSSPYLFVTSFSSGSIIYKMVKLHPGFSNYIFFCINLFCSISMVESVMMIVASVVPNVLMGIGIGTATIVLMLMASQLFQPLSKLPKFFWRYPMSYISYARWAIQGEYKNDLIGLEFDPFVPGGPKEKGEFVLQTYFGVPMDHSKWWDLMVLGFLVIAIKLLLYVVLKYKGRVTSMFPRRLDMERNLQRLIKRVSHAGQELSPSKRHHYPLHPLSTQEGLRSPIS